MLYYVGVSTINMNGFLDAIRKGTPDGMARI
jgi:hypothetical protein